MRRGRIYAHDHAALSAHRNHKIAHKRCASIYTAMEGPFFRTTAFHEAISGLRPVSVHPHCVIDMEMNAVVLILTMPPLFKLGVCPS